MADQASLYTATRAISLDVLAVHGASEPDRLSKFGVTHELLDGSLAEQIAGSRREISIDFNMMSILQRRQVVDWWLDPNRELRSLAGTPGSPAVTLVVGGSLTQGETYYFKISAVDVIGESIASAEVNTGAVGATNKIASLSWAAVTGARCYKIYGKESAGAYQLLRYVLGTSDTIGGIWANEIYKAATPPVAASHIHVISMNELEYPWAFETELARMLTLELREASIFTAAAGFPV